MEAVLQNNWTTAESRAKDGGCKENAMGDVKVKIRI